MPANLTPEYLQAEARFKAASTPAEKVAALEEMLRSIPKHKGTEKMQADIKRRLSQARKESQKKKPAASQKSHHQVEREGAGQIVLGGPPNSGKSQLLATLTHAHPEIAEFPFTTRVPQPGMMPFEDVQIQLVDMPPLAPGFVEPWELAILKNADAVLLIFDVNDPELLDQTEFTLRILKERGVEPGSAGKPRLLVFGNKVDVPGGVDNFTIWKELFENRFSAEPLSAKSPADMTALKGKLFELLEIVRVYTKAPGRKVEENAVPYVLKRGSTVTDVATLVHKDLALHFKFARVWGKTRFNGQMVERSYLLEDGDCVEIHV
ncbi:MAG: TGS domain-containing protein [Acidobacteria bacterium]|nr:TGS domain-containing protein [Acidobacteriota bacterium]